MDSSLLFLNLIRILPRRLTLNGVGLTRTVTPLVSTMFMTKGTVTTISPVVLSRASISRSCSPKGKPAGTSRTIDLTVSSPGSKLTITACIGPEGAPSTRTIRSLASPLSFATLRLNAIELVEKMTLSWSTASDTLFESVGAIFLFRGNRLGKN